jgi:predicted Zn-dependent peptidase
MNYDYAQLIDQVTSKDINEAVELLVSRKPTLVVTGNAVNLVPSIADIQQKIK